jgi:hypothetical protein
MYEKCPPQYGKNKLLTRQLKLVIPMFGVPIVRFGWLLGQKRGLFDFAPTALSVP